MALLPLPPQEEKNQFIWWAWFKNIWVNLQQILTFLNNGMSSVSTLTDSGSWTPVLVGAGSPTYLTQYGYFTRVGRLVTLVGKINVTGATLNANTLQITGLPFVPFEAADEQQRASCIIGGAWAGLGSHVATACLRTETGSLVGIRDNGAGTAIGWTYSAFSSTSFKFNFSISYICEPLL